ncbi:hypothetical protein [Silvibacterium acidisoli]|uniref:hypothetical protein n=1 Tax=Acidobacteriaceae bacterium ZG23-2 TaxID=2883246 RepID=UPI00406CB0B7
MTAPEMKNGGRKNPAYGEIVLKAFGGVIRGNQRTIVLPAFSPALLHFVIPSVARNLHLAHPEEMQIPHGVREDKP